MEKFKKVAGPIFGLILFSAAAWFLYKKAQTVTWEEFTAGLASIPTAYLVLAGVLVAINYLVLTGNDYFSVEYAGGSVPYRRVALASFLGYAFANNIGAVAAGIPVRARFYSAWGLRPAQLVSFVAFLSLSFWVGFWIVGGVFLSAVEVPVPEDMNLPVTSKVLGYLLLGNAALYVALCLWWRKPLSLGKSKLTPPGPPLMAKQMVIASLDLIIASATLYVLLPPGTQATYPEVVSVYLLALAAAMILQVPGGLGVLEAILLTLLATSDESAVMGSLLIFRIYYYILPLIIAAVLLVVAELRGVTKHQSSGQVNQEGDACSRESER